VVTSGVSIPSVHEVPSGARGGIASRDSGGWPAAAVIREIAMLPSGAMSPCPIHLGPAWFHEHRGLDRL